MKDLLTREGAVKHYEEIYKDYVDMMENYRYQATETKRHLLSFKRGQVLEAGYLLKGLYNFTDKQIEQIERKIERSYK